MPMNPAWRFIFLFIVILNLFYYSSCVERDYYELLGVSRSATNKDIRKAFKKLAILFHPDKNKDNPNADQRFMEMTAAYETLKDEESRRRYDLYGETTSSGKKQSWNYYQNEFGLYDDDDNVVTLTRGDFESLVIDDTQATWFVNYHSPQCSHCIKLVSTWRKLAAEWLGVFHLAAVNCYEEWQLCREQNIHYYPTLILYPQKEIYRSAHSYEELTSFLQAHLHIHVPPVMTPLIFSENDLAEENGQKTLPRLIFLCDEHRDCVTTSNRIKTSALLENLVQVWILDCTIFADLCSNYPKSSSVIIEDHTKIDNEETTSAFQSLFSLDPYEIANQVLKYIQSPPRFDDKQLEKIFEQLELCESRTPLKAWLIVYTLGEREEEQLELKKLAAHLSTSGISLGRVDCVRSSSICHEYNVASYPTYQIWKCSGRHETLHLLRSWSSHMGGAGHSLLASLARSSSQAFGVWDITPAFLEQLDTNELWLILFHAPWCPPCRRTLSELRRLSTLDPQLKIVLIDCVIYKAICNSRGINSYPTLEARQGQWKETFEGNWKQVNEWIQNLRSDSVLELDPASWNDLVVNKPKDELVLVAFHAPWCSPCRRLQPELRRLTNITGPIDHVTLARLDCEKYNYICQQQHVNSYPTLRIYPFQSEGLSTVAIHQGYQRDAASLRKWLQAFLPTNCPKYDERSINNEMIRDIEFDWLVTFYAPWCGPCHVFLPELEALARRLDHSKIKCIRIDCEQTPRLCHEASIHAYPTLRFYPKGHKRLDTGIDIRIRQTDSILEQIKNAFRSYGSAVRDEL